MAFIAKILKKIFAIHSPSKEWTKVPRVEYQEEDIKCDLCEYFTAYPEASKTIFDIMSENDISEQYKTCGRCIHDSESSDIVGSTCYMCKRNPDDHRIDWFEKKKEEN